MTQIRQVLVVSVRAEKKYRSCQTSRPLTCERLRANASGLLLKRVQVRAAYKRDKERERDAEDTLEEEKEAEGAD